MNSASMTLFFKYQTLCFTLLFLVLAHTLLGQNQFATTTVTLDEVAVEAVKISGAATQLPLAVSVRNFEVVSSDKQQLSLQEYLSNIPGLFTLNASNYAQDLRISIRGFGARAAFGIRGIKLVVDGIPETTPDGQGQVDNLPLGLIQRIEVLRGPSASLYGNASGGVLYINTLDELSDQKALIRTSIGAFGTFGLQAMAGVNSAKTKAVFYLNNTRSNGYRVQSGLAQSVLNAKVKHRFSDQSVLTGQLNYTASPLAEDAGGLTLDEVQQDRRQARARNVDYKTYEKVNQLKTGLRYEQKWGDHWTWDSYAFYSFRDFYGTLPFENGGIVDLFRNYVGLGSRLNFTQKSTTLRHEWQLGFETALQNDQRDRYNNMLGEQGALSFSQLESFGNISFYLVDALSFEKWLLRGALRFDRQKIGADSVDRSQIYNALNPSLGISYQILPKQRIFVSLGSSFETPTLSELSADPSGKEGLNLQLDPARAMNYELGWKSLGNRSSLEANLFYVRSSNEILPYELEAFPGRTFYRNGGATERYGFELQWEQHWKQWDWLLSLSQAKYVFETAMSQDKPKAIPGIPKQQASFELRYHSTKDWSWQLSGNHNAAFFANDANTIEIDDYRVFKLQTSKTFSFDWGHIQGFVGVNNLFNSTYFDNIRLNAFGGRYYEPAPGRHFFGGLAFGF